jgi:CRP-like cAMP-binding protein
VQLSTNQNAIVGYLGPGDLFGEKLFCTAPEITDKALSVTPITVEEYQKSELLAGFQNPQFANRVLGSLATRIDGFEQAVTDFITEQAKTRLARLFLRLVPSSATSGWVRLPVNPSNLELARMVGTTRWRVSHFLTEFQKMGWLHRGVGFSVKQAELRRFLGYSQGTASEG